MTSLILNMYWFTWGDDITMKKSFAAEITFSVYWKGYNIDIYRMLF